MALLPNAITVGKAEAGERRGIQREDARCCSQSLSVNGIHLSSPPALARWRGNSCSHTDFSRHSYLVQEGGKKEIKVKRREFGFHNKDITAVSRFDQRQLSCYEEPYCSLFSVADYECECWRTDPALTGGAGVPTAISTPPCVLEMTLDSTLKKSKKKQKPPKKSKRSSASPGRCRRCCGRFTTFLFSHVGLCALVIGYSIMGAFAFRALEAPYEEQKASQVGHLRQETVRRLWEITDKLNVLYKDNWTELVEAEVRRFQKELIVAVKEGYDGKEGSGQQWSFSGAFLYSLTVITTIAQRSVFVNTAVDISELNCDVIPKGNCPVIQSDVVHSVLNSKDNASDSQPDCRLLSEIPLSVCSRYS
ncbi:hypothetical protein TNIN_349811 [Trichonephila inaurata madagascariensis]|uniref:TWiK family of potassium channels protein 7 n=1 Tax=Trichonephila inaurata madagascariensis TaxID=2747483 RepID=A0A8X7BN02_9ARAC|nr:hypothetical protein TNIN_349811 [Trichonephila inaurata madagascariensis]